MEALAGELKLAVIPELGRQLCLDMGYNWIGEIPDQEGFKRQVLEAQISEETRLASFISDRSTIDCWVLWQRWNICSAMSYDTESYYNQTRKQGELYSEIIYIPPMFPPPTDSFRWTDSDYQLQIDRLVRMTLYEWNLLGRTYMVRSEGVQNRCLEVIDWLASRPMS